MPVLLKATISAHLIIRCLIKEPLEEEPEVEETAEVAVEAITMLKGPSRLTFNEENFLRALVDFIVADDQVRIVSY